MAKLSILNFVLLNAILATKAEFAEERTFFAKRFPSLRTFIDKKFGIQKKN